MPDIYYISKSSSFVSPTHGCVSFEDVAKYIVDYIRSEDKEYEIAIGTDSMTYDSTKFVLAITVHRLSNGGIFFYRKMQREKIEKNKLFEKLYYETEISLNASKILFDEMRNKGLDLENASKIHFKVHVDIGNHGKTKDYIQSIIGMVRSYGYDCEIKPDSYAASSIADMLTK